MYEFTYKQASSLDEAVRALAADADAILIAGGQTLIPTLKQRLAAPSSVHDISRIEALRGIGFEGGVLRIGAMTRHAEVAGSAIVRANVPGLADLAGNIGDPHVRHRGTIGGSIANNDPAADYPAACLALGARIETDRRTITAEDFFVGLFETALEEGEIVTAVSFPIPLRMAYAKFPNPASRYALVGVCAALTDNGPRIAVTGCGQDGVFRWAEAEAALDPFDVAGFPDITPDPATLSSDIHAQSDYRAHLVGVMTRRALNAALQGAE